MPPRKTEAFPIHILTSINYPAQVAKKPRKKTKDMKGLGGAMTRTRRRAPGLTPSQLSVKREIKLEGSGQTQAAFKGKKVRGIKNRSSTGLDSLPAQYLTSERLDVDELYLLWDHLVRIFGSGYCNFEPTLISDRNALLDASCQYKETEAIATRIRELEFERRSAVDACSQRPTTETGIGHLNYTSLNPNPTYAAQTSSIAVAICATGIYNTSYGSDSDIADGPWIQSSPFADLSEIYDLGYEHQSYESPWTQGGYSIHLDNCTYSGWAI